MLKRDKEKEALLKVIEAMKKIIESGKETGKKIEEEELKKRGELKR
jgi:hypothetical protein